MSLLSPYKDLNPQVNTLAKTYVGVVVDNNDPLKLQRVKVRIEELFGNLDTLSLPWCVKDNPASNTNSSGDFCVPAIGQVVEVEFDNNCIYSPRYKLGLVNSTPSYITEEDYLTASGYGDQLGNFFKFNDKGITLQDKNGNKITMNETGITLSDKNGNTVVMDTAGITLNGNLVTINAPTVVNDALTVNSTITSTGDSINGGISTMSHVHKGNLGNDTSPPVGG